MSGTALELQGLHKNFGQLLALNNINLAVAESEFVTLLGPSGCGKTTLLRNITGYLQPDSGRILLGGVDITELPPHKRNMGMVFQSFALFPHLTVYDNIAFPLKVRRVAAAEQKKLIEEALRMVQLERQTGYFPRQLSGGQQQRVGLARPVVFRPAILLLDEPLSNLDANLREELRTEINHVTRRLGVAAIYVTHDQQEALALSDRIVVMNHGRIVQVGTPEEIYHRPRTRFVADFISHSNCFGVEVSQGSATISGVNGVLTSEDFRNRSGSASVFIHPSDVVVSGKNGHGKNELGCRVTDAVFLGDRVEYILELNAKVRLRALSIAGGIIYPPGSSVWAVLPPAKIVVVEDDVNVSQ